MHFRNERKFCVFGTALACALLMRACECNAHVEGESSAADYVFFFLSHLTKAASTIIALCENEAAVDIKSGRRRLTHGDWPRSAARARAAGENLISIWGSSDSASRLAHTRCNSAWAFYFKFQITFYFKSIIFTQMFTAGN